MADTTQRVTRILVEHLGVEPAKVRPDIRLIPEDHAKHHWSDSGGGENDLGADSLDVVEIVMALEDEFRIEIPEEATQPLLRATVNDLVTLVDRKLAERG